MCVVRNPYSRVVSAYFNGQEVLKKNSYPYYEDFERYDSFSQFCLDPDNPFLFGFSTVRRPPRKNRARYIHVKHVHFRSQCFWLKNSQGAINIDYILRFETLNEDWNKFLEEVQLPPRKLPRKNISKHDQWQKYYTDKEAEVIYKRYQEDFEALKYSKQSYIKGKYS